MRVVDLQEDLEDNALLHGQPVKLFQNWHNMFSPIGPGDYMHRTVLDSLGSTIKLGRQESIGHVESECNKGVYQLFSGCLWQKGMNAADVPKVVVGAAEHTQPQLI